MARFGHWTSGAGLLTSIAGTVLLFTLVKDEYHSSIQGIGSIALGYLGLIILGVCISVTGVALLQRP